MGIVYLISVLLLLITFILIKKTEKTLDIISFTGISIVLFLSYNVFVCYILTFIIVPQNLLVLSLINFGVSIPMAAIILKSKQIQKYKFDKFSLISVLIILLVTFFVSCFNFGLPFKIKYETGDPATHYYTSALFAKDKELLTRNVDDVYYLRVRKIGSYVNSGIIMQCFSNVLQKADFYNIFILFGIFILFMTGYIMYCTLEKYTNSRGRKDSCTYCKLNICFGLSFK